MRILDFHTHPHRPTDLNPAMRAWVRRTSPAVREHGDALSDPRHAAALLRADGIERAVLLPEHCPATSGHVRTETVLELCRQVPDFFVPFACVNPNLDPDPLALLRRYLEEGAAGLKLYPSYQFFHPHERRMYRLYEACAARGVPVLFHVGSSVVPGTRLEYCHPLHLVEVAVDFPELPLVMAHGGRGLWYEECAFLARHYANIYIDVAGLPPSRLLERFPELERLAAKVVFGSDWPGMPTSPGANARVLAGLGLSSDAVDRILYRNAARLLGLAGAAGGPPDREDGGGRRAGDGAGRGPHGGERGLEDQIGG
jgi:uncharacterized protein